MQGSIIQMSYLDPVLSVFNFCYHSKTTHNISQKYKLDCILLSASLAKLLANFQLYSFWMKMYTEMISCQVSDCNCYTTEKLIFIWKLKIIFKKLLLNI